VRDTSIAPPRIDSCCAQNTATAAKNTPPADSTARETRLARTGMTSAAMAKQSPAIAADASIITMIFDRTG
jgi:hypothetical protein